MRSRENSPELKSSLLPHTVVTSTVQIIAIGSSTGGTEAVETVLSALPPAVPGIVVAQHIPTGFSNIFAKRLDAKTQLSVREAKSGDVVTRGTVLIAPGDHHLRVKKDGNQLVVVCTKGAKVSGHRPSVDVLFDSIATQIGRRSIGVILTGMGNDGAQGLLAMRQKGARTIGQDKDSSIVYGMPKAAFDIGAVERQVCLQSIPRVLLEFLK